MSASKGAPSRFIVTAHAPSSFAPEPQVTIIVDERPSDPLPHDIGGIGTRWTSLCTPALNGGDDMSPGRYVGKSVIPGGSHLKVVDLAPGKSTPMHRSSALDYNIIVSGSVVLLTPGVDSSTVLSNSDEGVTRTVVRAGDCVVQRGTMHAWQNDTAEWARWIVVILEAEPVKTAAGVLQTRSLH